MVLLMTGANALELCALYALQQPPPPVTQTAEQWGAGSGSLAVQIILLITTLSGFVYTIYRENRNRRWDLEDRERARQELAQRVELATLRQASAATQHRDEIMEVIDKNTQMNEAALREANDVNRRIHDITRMFTEAKAEAQDAANTVADKAAAVEHEIHESAETLGRVEHNTQEAVARLRIITHD